MKRIVPLFLLGALLLAIPACSGNKDGSFMNKLSAVREFTFCATLDARQKIQYGFFLLPSTIPFVYTTDRQAPPGSNGVYWVRDSVDGLWVNGKQIDTTKAGAIMAIRPDGSIYPVTLDDSTLQVLTTEFGSIIMTDVNLAPVRAVLNEKDLTGKSSIRLEP